MLKTFAYYASVFYKDFSAYTAEKLEAVGLHYGLMFFVLYVGKHPGTTPSALTNALRVDWGHSQRSINRLVEEGLMSKEKSGRYYRLNLTDKGKQAYALCHQVFFMWDGLRLSALTPQEQDTLLALLQKIAVFARKSE